MEPVVHTITARTHGRFLVSEPEQGPARLLVVGFHGYGEHAAGHLEELARLRGARPWRLVAIQALHRFYSSRTRQVIASWMTSEDRELAIADNVQYVAAVVSVVKASAGGAMPLAYVGFSQGTAMAYRAAARGGHACAALVALGGDVPPEIRDDPSAALPPVLIGRGDQDTWYTADKLDQDVSALRSRTSVEACVFEGGHAWTDAFRATAARFLASRAR